MPGKTISMNELEILIWIIGGFAFCTAFIFITGLLLPRKRVVTRQSIFDTTPEKLYRIVTNNNDWKYRQDIKELHIIEQQDDKEIWEEISKGGGIVRFKTREKIPYSFYSFDMQAKYFHGYWTARFDETEDGKTLFTATEIIRVKNPFMKTLAYVFFDIGKFMENYQQYLQRKIDHSKP